jgi:transcriptional regulator with XRE-family HTH domain
MKVDRRILSSSLSAQIIEYLRKHGHSQAKIARMLGVSQGFVSLVKSRERGLTLDHIERLSLALSIPMGAFLLAATKPRKVSKRNKEFFESSAKIIKMCDDLREILMRTSAISAR